jgi:hypothetical protein
MQREISAASLYRAKEERRKKLAALPIDERVKIIERLHRFARSMRELKGGKAPRR